MQVPHYAESVECGVIFKKQVRIVPTTSVNIYTYSVSGANSLRKGMFCCDQVLCRGVGMAVTDVCNVQVLTKCAS